MDGVLPNQEILESLLDLRREGVIQLLFVALLLNRGEDAMLVELSEQDRPEQLVHHHVAADVKSEEEQNGEAFVYAWHAEGILEDAIPSVVGEEDKD